MIAAPRFASLDEYGSRLDDAAFWRPYVVEALRRRGLSDRSSEPVAGFVGTYPTFLCGDVVVKLFGRFDSWHDDHATERAAYDLIKTDPEIKAPNLVESGQLYTDPTAPWPYLITTRVPGVAWRDATLSSSQRLSIAAQVGRQVQRVHARRTPDVTPHGDWPALNLADAARRHRQWRSLPPHLTAQIDAYLADLGPFDRVFVHADLTADHAYVESGRLTSIIDWGDAMVTDRHYELAAIYFDMFGGDKALLRAFLDASDWPIDERFPQKALALTLAHRFDVLASLGEVLTLQKFDTLDDLAIELFGVHSA